MTDVRVHPLIEVSHVGLIGLAGDVVHVERVDGGLTNTIHRVTRRDGSVVGVKHFVEQASFEAELATLTLLHGTVPVPDVVCADAARAAIVYHWIDGVTLNDCRKRDAAGFGSLAQPLGSLLAKLAATDATEPYELEPILARTHEQLASGRPRIRIGAPLADALRAALDRTALSWGSVCLVHGDFGGRNVIVQRGDGERWQVGGVIDWEATSTGSPLFDLGSLFRYSDRYDDAFRAAFERSYVAAGGELPADWWRAVRLLDATWVVDTLDDGRELPGVYADCRMLLARLVADCR